MGTTFITLLNSLHFTGQAVTDPVTVPVLVGEDFGEITCIVSAPISDLNIFDITLNIETLEDGEWKLRDTNNIQREIDLGAVEPVNITIFTRMENISGKQMRATFSCGQSFVSVNVTLAI